MAQAESQKNFADEILLDDLQAFLRQQAENPDDHLAPYQAGLIYSRLGQYDEAVRSYHRAIERFPDFQQAYYNLGAAWTALGRNEEAEQAYHKSIALDGNDSEAWANLGAVQEALGRLDDALASYGHAAQLETDEQEARLRMARIHLRRGAFDQAQALCEDALEREPELAEAWNDLGLVFLHQGHRTRAEGCYHKAVEFRPDFAQAWGNLANLMAGNNDDAAAERGYREALRHDDQDPDLWFNLGEFYLQRDRQGADRCLWRTVELNRGDLEAWDLLHRWYQKHPDPERLLGVLRVLVAARPDDTVLAHEMARTAEVQREFEQALLAYRSLLAHDPADEAAHLGLVRVYLREGQLLEAYRHLGEVEGAGPEIVDHWVHLGHRLRHRGRREEAEDCFQQALEHRPNEPELAAYLGEIALERKEFDRAFDWFERAGEITRNDRHVWIPLMRRFFGTQDYARAATCLDHLEELAQYLPSLWVEYDEVYSKAGRRDELRGRILRWLELGMVGAVHWRELAELYDRSGEGDRAAQLRARAETADAALPFGSALTAGTRGGLSPEQRAQEPRRSGIVLPMEGDGAEDPVDIAAAYPTATHPTATHPTAVAPTAMEDAIPAVPAAAATAVDAVVDATAAADPDYWIEQGEQHLREGRVDDAATSLQTALSLDDSRYRTWFRMGGLFYLLRKLEQAEDAFAKAAAMNPDEAKAWYNLGVCQAEAGRTALARESFHAALARQRRMAKAWDWLGLLHFNAGEHAQARRCFVRCLASDRTAVNAWHNLGMLYRTLGWADESTRCLDEARRLGGVLERPRIFDQVAESPAAGAVGGPAAERQS